MFSSKLHHKKQPLHPLPTYICQPLTSLHTPSLPPKTTQPTSATQHLVLQTTQFHLTPQFPATHLLSSLPLPTNRSTPLHPTTCKAFHFTPHSKPLKTHSPSPKPLQSSSAPTQHYTYSSPIGPAPPFHPNPNFPASPIILNPKPAKISPIQE